MRWFDLARPLLLWTLMGVILAASHYRAYQYGRDQVTQKWDAERRIAAESLARAQSQARETERSLQVKADELRQKNEAQLQTIRARLGVALDQLRQRPSRSEVPSATETPCAAAPATGAQLSREDAGFLAREAARADRLVDELMQCRAAYENAKAAFDQTQ